VAAVRRLWDVMTLTIAIEAVLSKPSRKRFAVAANLPTPRPGVMAFPAGSYD
jgi:hypothetical protein